MDLNYFIIKHGEFTIEFDPNKEQLQADATARKEFKKKIEVLFNEITVFINSTGNLGYYAKLITIEKYWQEAFPHFLGEALDLGLKIDRSKLKIMDATQNQTIDIDQTFYDEKRLQEWLDTRAYDIYQSRCTRLKYIESGKERSHYYSAIGEDEAIKNWHTAEVHFASDVLSGRIFFSRKIDPEIYYHLENIWLKELKELDAFFIWNDILHFWDDGKREFHHASEYLRLMLEINEEKEFFEKTAHYIQECYLDSRNKIDFSKAHLKNMIDKKAYHIAINTSSWDNHAENWNKAVKYTTMFYENIIPAINNANAECILMALKAFQYSNAAQPEYGMINCFEAAIAIYFINDDIIKNFWDAAAGESLPVPPDESRISLNYDPKISILINKLPHNKLIYEKQRGELVFYGVMQENELTILQKALPRNKPENKVIHKAIDNLYKKSRLLPKEVTL